MKKLLCVLMFGMVFGQDAITTKEFTITITQNTESINIYDLVGGESQGLYSISIIHLSDIIAPNDCADYLFEGSSPISNSNYDHFMERNQKLLHLL